VVLRDVTGKDTKGNGRAILIDLAKFDYDGGMIGKFQGMIGKFQLFLKCRELSEIILKV